jgi:hypothetical protein
MTLSDRFAPDAGVPDEYAVARFRAKMAGELYGVVETLRAVHVSGALDREEIVTSQRAIGAISALADRLHRPPGRMPRDP